VAVIEQDARAPAALTAARGTGVVLTGVLAGAVLAVWLLDRRLGASGELYAVAMQEMIPAYTVPLPTLGAVALLATVIAAILARRDRRACALTVGAAALLVVGLAVTTRVNLPLNEAILTWTPRNPPADWQQVRERWSAAHTVRTVTALGAAGLLALVLGRRRG